MERLFDAGVMPAVNVAARRDSSAYGKVAEQLAIAELLRRDHKVAVPVVDDDGVDLVVNYRWRVQVKNSHRQRLETVPGYVYDGFKWTSKRGWCEADVFLLFGSGRWFVVPAVALADHGKTLVSYAGAQRGMAARLGRYEEAWHWFDG